MNTLYQRKDIKYGWLNLQLCDRPGFSSQNALWYLHAGTFSGAEKVQCYYLRALWLVMMKVSIVLSTHNMHLKVESFIYWHHFAIRSFRQVALRKGYSCWKSQDFSSGKAKKAGICSLTVLVHYTTNIKCINLFI